MGSSTFALLLALQAVPYQQPGSAKEMQAYLDVLAATPFGTVYFDDGCACGTITDGETIASGPLVRPHKAVRDIVELREAVVPFLISHLDDTRETAIEFQRKPVPIAHLALDILTHVVKSTDRIFVRDCADDGLGACIRPGFYFRPDATPMQMAVVKARWQTAMRRGWLKFQYPAWWSK